MGGPAGGKPRRVLLGKEHAVGHGDIPLPAGHQLLHGQVSAAHFGEKFPVAGDALVKVLPADLAEVGQNPLHPRAVQLVPGGGRNHQGDVPVVQDGQVDLLLVGGEQLRMLSKAYWIRED